MSDVKQTKLPKLQNTLLIQRLFVALWSILTFFILVIMINSWNFSLILFLVVTIAFLLSSSRMLTINLGMKHAIVFAAKLASQGEKVIAIGSTPSRPYNIQGIVLVADGFYLTGTEAKIYYKDIVVIHASKANGNTKVICSMINNQSIKLYAMTSVSPDQLQPSIFELSSQEFNNVAIPYSSIAHMNAGARSAYDQSGKMNIARDFILYVFQSHGVQVQY